MPIICERQKPAYNSADEAVCGGNLHHDELRTWPCLRGDTRPIARSARDQCSLVLYVETCTSRATDKETISTHCNADGMEIPGYGSQARGRQSIPTNQARPTDTAAAKLIDILWFKFLSLAAAERKQQGSPRAIVYACGQSYPPGPVWPGETPLIATATASTNIQSMKGPTRACVKR